MDDLAGITLAHYRLMEKIGQGGMASVYKATHPAHPGAVAIKILPPAMAQDPQFFQRFRREALVVMELKHSQIVPVLDFGEADGYAYLVMPYFECGSLADRQSQGPVTQEEGARWVEQIASALDYAHQRGIVHRDVKPSNILLDEEGSAHLADFGLLRLHDASLSLTGSALIGTPTYISPEQARGDPVDARSDQYSLGILLFQLVTGRLPYQADTPIGVLIKHINEPLPRPRSISPGVPEVVERVILKATAKTPAERFASVRELTKAFTAALEYSQDPRNHPRPKIALPALSASATPLDRGMAWIPPGRRRLAFWLVSAGMVLAALFICPVASSGLMERDARPVSGGGISSPESDGPQLTALAGTIAALSTQVVGTSMSGTPLPTVDATQITTIEPSTAFTSTYSPVMANTLPQPSTPTGSAVNWEVFPTSPVELVPTQTPAPGHVATRTPTTTSNPPGLPPTWTASPTSIVPGRSPTPTASTPPTHTQPAPPLPTPTRTSTALPTLDSTPAATPTLPALRGIFFLHNDPSPPFGDTNAHGMLPMVETPPLGVLLFNYDANRDDDPGLKIQRGGSGFAEDKSAKHQRWRSDVLPTSLQINSTPQLIIWAAIKDFEADENGSVRAYLAATNGSNIAWAISTEVQGAPWHRDSDSWVQKTLTFEAIHTFVPEGYWLELVLLVPDLSDEDMWFAYDTIAHPARLILP